MLLRLGVGVFTSKVFAFIGEFTFPQTSGK